jgi:hypothetical protein
MATIVTSNFGAEETAGQSRLKRLARFLDGGYYGSTKAHEGFDLRFFV